MLSHIWDSDLQNSNPGKSDHPGGGDLLDDPLDGTGH